MRRMRGGQNDELNIFTQAKVCVCVWNGGWGGAISGNETARNSDNIPEARYI